MAFKKYNEGTLNYIKEHYECSCHSSEHQIIVKYTLDDTGTKLEEDPYLYLEVHLSNYKGFFKRFWAGIKYILGHKSRYGDFDCLLFKDQDIDNLLEVLNSYKELRKKND